MLFRDVDKESEGCCYGVLEFDSADFGDLGFPFCSSSDRSGVYLLEPPPPTFFTVSFDGSFYQGRGGTVFIIRASSLGFLVAGSFSVLDSSVPTVELYATWAGIRYARQILHLDYLIIEEIQLLLSLGLLG